MTLSARPVDKPDSWYNRYARHITLEEVGETGQLALGNASVLLIGAGGLGSPIAFYLAAAGVGRLGLVDFDIVTINNLQRQILHATDDVGRLKVDSARATLSGINPEIDLETYPEKVTQENVWELVQGYDIIVDGSDNFATRFLINDVCVQAGKPLVFGAVLQFSGQVTTFTQEGDCGCYRCLFPEAPDPKYAPSCTEAGIFGVTTGIIGSIQASQALQLILNRSGHYVGAVLENRLLLYDGNDSEFRTIKLSKNPACPVCSDPDFDFRQVKYVDGCVVRRADNTLLPAE
jgi:adenylyltransferase/sulfurtransferase